MAYAAQYPLLGSAPLNLAYASDTTQRQVLGSIVGGVDNFWGEGEFMYLKSNDVILLGSVVIWNNLSVATLVPNAAIQGIPVAVALVAAAAGNFFWAFVSASQAPVVATASVAAGTGFGITGVGTVGAIAAGKQINNAKSVVASAGTVVKSASIINGSAIVIVGNTDGWFPGVAITGTGIPASTTITAMSPDGRTVTLNNAATATGQVSLTGTYTGFIIAQFDRPFAQGAIT
jgi:hypothetical protein